MKGDTARDQTDLGGRLPPLLARRTDRSDTHPCLRERLDAIGAGPALPGPLTRSAGCGAKLREQGEQLLCALADRVGRSLDMQERLAEGLVRFAFEPSGAATWWPPRAPSANRPVGRRSA